MAAWFATASFELSRSTLPVAKSGCSPTLAQYLERSSSVHAEADKPDMIESKRESIIDCDIFIILFFCQKLADAS
jgi:hypothetical protein